MTCCPPVQQSRPVQTRREDRVALLDNQTSEICCPNCCDYRNCKRQYVRTNRSLTKRKEPGTGRGNLRTAQFDVWQLDAHANRLARYPYKRGVGAESVVGIRILRTLKDAFRFWFSFEFHGLPRRRITPLGENGMVRRLAGCEKREARPLCVDLILVGMRTPT